ncbi:MAG TPA: SDR family oxidoreductase [Mycobacterium sp.]|nr:SDR family oxidoreductase [Mycobacterium sp.]
MDTTGEHRALHGLTAIVTGGAGGIGSATAEALLRDGADVLISGRTAAKLEAVAARLAPIAAASGGSINWLVGDALVEDDVADLVALAERRRGRVDIAVNVVGSASAFGPILRAKSADLEQTMRQNVSSAFHVIKHAGASMVRAGGGSIVAVSSMQATETAPLMSFYCAAKAGLEMMCRVAADELGQSGVRVNLVRPGLTKNGRDGHLSENEAVLAAYYDQQPIRRVGETTDIANAIRFLAGPESDWTTGTSLTVDGGTSLRRFPDLDFHWQPILGEELAKAARGEID